MSTFFSLNDGSLSATSTYGYSVPIYEKFDASSSIILPLSSTPSLFLELSNGGSISAIALNIYSRSTPASGYLEMEFNIGLTPTLTAMYPISSFTSYNATNNLFTTYPQNWQILKLPTPLSSNINDIIVCKISTTTDNQLSLVGDRSYYDVSHLNVFNPNNTGTITYDDVIYNGLSESALYLNGSSYLSATNNGNFSFGTDDFTIEAWIRSNSVASSTNLITTDTGGSQTGVFRFGTKIGTTNALAFTWGSNGLATIHTANVNDGNWHHVAVCRNGTNLAGYVDGVLGVILPIGSYDLNSNNNVWIGHDSRSSGSYYVGNISIVKVIKGFGKYTSNFTPPKQNEMLLDSSIGYYATTLLLKSGISFNKSFITNNTTLPTSNDIFHIGGVMNGSIIEPRILTVDTLTANSIFIHNKGTLSFPLTDSKTLTVTGSGGLRVTSGGTLNIGTSAAYIPANYTHTIVLSNTQLDVDNGGTLNVYGAPKFASTYLVSDSLSGSNNFITTDSVSSTWNTSDKLLFTPNLTAKNSFDVLTINTFTASNQFTTTASSSSTHLGVSSLPYVPSVTNLTRNVKIKGSNSSNRAIIRAIGDSNVFLSNVQFNSFGVNATNKNGLIYGGTSNGSLTLSGVVFDNDYTTGVGNVVRLTDRPLQNLTLSNNVFYNTNGDGISFVSVSSNNVNITNNLILSSATVGINLQLVSGNMDVRDNITVSTSGHGLYLLNNTFSAKSPEFKSTNYNSGARGLSLESNISGISSFTGNYINSTQDGIYVNAATFKLSAALIKDVVSSNNTLDGFKVVGNNTNYLTPLFLNVNGLTASNNSDTGLEVYNITGNLSNIYVSNNAKTNIKSSIGNGDIFIDNLSSILDTMISYSKPLTVSTTYPTISSANPFNILSEGSFLINNNNYIIDDNDGELIFGSNDFTIEFFTYLNNSSTSGYIMNKGKNNYGVHNFAWHIFSSNGSDIILNINDDITTPGLNISNSISKNNWHHVCITRYNGTITTFFNGVSADSRYISNINYFTNPIYIAKPDSGFPLAGWYFSNIRIVNGVSMYNTNNFSVPTTPLILTSDTKALIQYPYNNIYKKVYNNDNVKFTSATNYAKTIIKNSSINSYGNLEPEIMGKSKGLTLSSNILEDFRMENSSILAYTPLSITSNRSKIEGSYHFHNCNSSSYNLSGIALAGYQNDVFVDSGFAVMRENGLSGRHYKQLAAGRISYDTTVLHTLDDIASEKLEPMSSSVKMRSSSRQISMNSGDSFDVSVYVKKSSNYTGSAPRLMLKDNSQLGFNETILHTSILPNNTWELMSGTIPAALVNGVADVYVDCSGSVGCGSINIDDWDFS